MVRQRHPAVAADHGLPVSAANTTRRARPPSPTNSGHVVCFLRRASSKTTPRLAASSESRRKGDTNVVSIASCGSLPHGQPVCDHLDPSSIEAIESSHVAVVWGHPSPNLLAHLGCSTPKRKPPPFPKPLPRSTLHDDGQTCRVGGHIGKCVRTRARASGGVCTVGCGKVAPQFSSSCWWASS